MRASQLDAARLDTELSAMLKEQFMKIFSYFQPRLISAFQPELTLILELLVSSNLLFAAQMVVVSLLQACRRLISNHWLQIFRFSVWAGKPTPGSALMNLRYRDERQICMKRKSSSGSSQPGGNLHRHDVRTVFVSAPLRASFHSLAVDLIT